MHRSRLLLAALAVLLCAPISQTHALRWETIGVSTGSQLPLPLRLRKPVRQQSKPALSARGDSLLRNTQRRKDLTNLASAFFSYRRDHQNALPHEFPLFPTEICASESAKCKGMVDMTPYKKYLFTPAIPRDPQAPAGDGTRYFVNRDYADRLWLSAPDAEDGWSIRKQK